NPLNLAPSPACFECSAKVVYSYHFDAPHIVARFEFSTELWIGRLNPKDTRLYFPPAKFGWAIHRVDIAWRPPYFRGVSQFVYALARLPPGVRFFRRRAHRPPPIVAPFSRNRCSSDTGMRRCRRHRLGLMSPRLIKRRTDVGDTPPRKSAASFSLSAPLGAVFVFMAPN